MLGAAEQHMANQREGMETRQDHGSRTRAAAASRRRAPQVGANNNEVDNDSNDATGQQRCNDGRLWNSACTWTPSICWTRRSST